MSNVNVEIENYDKIFKLVKRLTKGKLNYWPFCKVLVYVYLQGVYHAVEILDRGSKNE